MASVLEEFEAQPPFQTQIKRLSATPEGVIDAPAGTIVVTTVGTMYIKTTESGVNTGWEIVTTT